MVDSVQPEDPPDISLPPIHAWSWGRTLRRHWVLLYFSLGLLLHIGCLVALQVAETETDLPATGSLGVLQTVASRLMYANILAMCVAVLLESHLFYRRLQTEVPPDLLDSDCDIPQTKKQAAKELRFISMFFARRWREPFRIVGLIGGVLLKLCAWLLVPCVLASLVRIFLPAKVVPDLAVKCIHFGLAIASLLCLVAGLMTVLNWMFFKYEEAKKKVSAILGQTFD